MRMQHEILDAIAALPGVAPPAFTSALPMEGAPFIGMAGGVEGRTLAAGDTPPPRRFKFVSPGYFETMGTRIIAGRDITWSDIEAGGRVALISEEFRARARRRSRRTRSANASGRPSNSDDWREVIGVVQSVNEDALYAEAPTLVYWPALMENAFGNAAFGVAGPRS